jgi:hypothetical protein
VGRVLTEGDLLVHQFSTKIGLQDRPLPPEPLIVESNPGFPWLVWGGIGVAAIGAAVVIAILAQPRLPDSTGTIGRISVDR